MPATDYTSNFLKYNLESSKNLVVAVEIDGLSTILTSARLYKRAKYGDPDLYYGKPGLVYGGLIDYPNYKSLIDLEGGSLTISQRLEPEQGRGAVSTLSISFIDKDQFMTQLISPGVLIPDILGASVKILIGYQEINFPNDYYVAFRGRVSSYDSMSGRVTLQFSDPNMARRQQIFYTPVTKLSAKISANDTTIPVVSNTDFHKQILGPDGLYDSSITTYLTIGDEIIQYPATGFGVNQFTGCTRGVRGTTKSDHEAGDDVSCSLQLSGNPIDLALKLMLSGFNGPYAEDISVLNFVSSISPEISSQPGLIVLQTNVDADRDYGISTGDYLTISGAAVSGNNVTCQVLQIVDMGDLTNNALITDATFTTELLSSAVFSVRSQFDTLPVSCGVKLPATEVDVKRHLDIRNTFLVSSQNNMRFYISETESSCKTFLENQIYLPMAGYSLTRFGRLSMNITRPPIADERLQFLDGTNVLNPQSIKPSRGVNNRKFFNQINWTYDYLDDGQTPQTTVKTIDTNSLNVIGVTSVLPITAKGLRTDIGSSTVVDRRTAFLLSRYKNGAVIINIETNWGTGCLIEAGDVVAVKDGGVLQISNFISGTRNLGTQLFEVINRDLDIKAGRVRLQLVSGLGAQVTDRYATISPSSILIAGSTPTKLMIGDSYGAKYPGQEFRKWLNYDGVNVLVHDVGYASYSATATITSIGSITDPNVINVTGLSIPASALPGLVVDVAPYSTSTDPNDQQIVKEIHAFLSPKVVVASVLGPSGHTQFTVNPSDIDKFQVGFPIVLHTADYSTASSELLVSNVDTGTYTITTSGTFPFNPSYPLFATYLGFPDGLATYRYI